MNANDFSKRYILELKNVLKFKGIISEMDVEKIVTKMMKYIVENGAVRVGDIVLSLIHILMHQEQHWQNLQRHNHYQYMKDLLQDLQQ